MDAAFFLLNQDFLCHYEQFFTAHKPNEQKKKIFHCVLVQQNEKDKNNNDIKTLQIY